MPADEISLPDAPQTGRMTLPPAQREDQQHLWSQLLARFRDLSGAFDPFANDADPQVRVLGRLARQRVQPQANDLFALGDLCARLVVRDATLSRTYAAKTLAAYTRASDIAPHEERAARQALVTFALWCNDLAHTLGDYEALDVALLVCERVRNLGAGIALPNGVERLRIAEERLREQIGRIMGEAAHRQASTHLPSERESRMRCDQGQMLLRQNQTHEALSLFEQAIQADDTNATAWVWCAMALTDLGRFDEALERYDRALALDPNSAAVWNSKGALLLELGRSEPALTCFERAIELSRAVDLIRALYWLNKGKALYTLQHYPEALAALTASHELDPSPESAAGIAACQEQLRA